MTSWKEIAGGDMPPWYYTALHGEARLTARDKADLQSWTGGGEARSDSDE